MLAAVWAEQAAYHGVPIAGVPLIGDQADNIVKAVARGFGVMVAVDHEGIQASSVSTAILNVLSNASFKEAAKKISVRMRARPRTPLEEAAGDNIPLMF
jgi:glucuronosyltransferase